jgi:hypothetical protein
VTGRAEIPALVLTAAETLLIRSDAVLGPPRPAQPRAPQRNRQHPRWRRTLMLTGITTRPSTPQEAEPWPGGSARPVLDYLTGTLGMTGAGARDLLKAARTARAATGPGALAGYPLPGADAHLLIHYAPGSRSYRFQPHRPGREPGTARYQPGTGHRAREPSRPGRAAGRPGNAGRQPGRRRRRHACPRAGGDYGHDLA